MGPLPKSQTEMEKVMTKSLRRWRSGRRYRTTLRALSSLTARQLRELGIRPVEIQHLAREAARGRLRANPSLKSDPAPALKAKPDPRSRANL